MAISCKRKERRHGGAIGSQKVINYPYQFKTFKRNLIKIPVNIKVRVAKTATPSKSPGVNFSPSINLYAMKLV